MAEDLLRLLPIQPEVASMFMGQPNDKRLGLSKQPMNLFVHHFPLVPEGVRASFTEGFDELKVNDAGLFLNLAPDRSLVVASITFFHVAFRKIPVALRILEEEDGAEVDQHHTAGGLHVRASEAPLMAFATFSAS